MSPFCNPIATANCATRPTVANEGLNNPAPGFPIVSCSIMANLAFKRAIADMNVSNKRTRTAATVSDTTITTDSSAVKRSRATASASSANTSASLMISDQDLGPEKYRIALSDDVSAVLMHQLAITLRPLSSSSGGGGRALLTASRWEIRKAIMSLCSTTPAMFEIEATDKSASIRISFSVGAAAEDLSRKLRGVTVKINGVKLHAFVRDVSESSTLSEGENWEAALLGPSVPESGREAAFDRLRPGQRPDTIVVRGIPANWVGDHGKAAEGTSAKGLETIMSRLGAVRSVEVAPCVPDDSPKSTHASAAAGSSNNGKALDFDVHALLENMPQPRALAKGKVGGGGGGRGGATGAGGGGGGAVGGLSVGLNVDAWVQFASFRGFGMALRALQGRVLQKAGAELVCEYRLGVDVTGYMTEERRREREEMRTRQAKEEERRKASIDTARGKLVGLQEGLQGLEKAVQEDGRPAVEEAVKETITKVTGHVEKAEALLGVHVVDEPAAVAAVSHAKGEIAIARLSIRKARAAVDRAEEEERKQLEREKDKQVREEARLVLLELEDTLSRGLALVDGQREHPGIKPQADRAAMLLGEISEVCPKEGGSEVLQEGELVAEARRATETATTRMEDESRSRRDRQTALARQRACMLQRYLNMSTRLAALRATVKAVAVLDDNSDSANNNNSVNNRGADTSSEATVDTSGDAPAKGGGATNAGDCTDPAENRGAATNSSTTTTSAAATRVPGGAHLMAQMGVAEGILSRELEGLSEGDLLLISESAEEALDLASGMLDTLKLVNTTRLRLAGTMSVMAGDPEVKSSEGVMRLVAAAVMSVARAQREGATMAPPSASSMPTSTSTSTPSSTSLAEAADRWKRAAMLADSEVAAAEQEVERVTEQLRAKRQREEEEAAWRRAELERRCREEEVQRAERRARALKRELLERKKTEARILAMELRKKEMTAQVRNKAARERLEGSFKAQLAVKKKPASGDGPPAITDRWTLDEGPVGSNDGGDASAARTATSTATPGTKTPNGNGGQEKLTPQSGGLQEDRWDMNDGAAELAERGVEVVGAGLYLESSSRAVWLEWVSKRMRGAVRGGVPADSPLWLVKDEREEEDDDDVSVDEDERDNPISSAPKKTTAPSSPFCALSRSSSSAAAEDEGPKDPLADVAGREAFGLLPTRSEVLGASGAKVVAGENAEAALRQRLLAAMGKSKGKKRRPS